MLSDRTLILAGIEFQMKTFLAKEIRYGRHKSHPRAIFIVFAFIFIIIYSIFGLTSPTASFLIHDSR